MKKTKTVIGKNGLKGKTFKVKPTRNKNNMADARNAFILVLRITETGAVVYMVKKSFLVALRFILGVLGGDQIPQSAETYDRGHKHGGVFSHGVECVPSTDHDGHHGTGGGDLREIG